MKKLTKYHFSDLYKMSSGISTSKDQAGHGNPFLSFSVVFNNYFLPIKIIDKMDTSEKEQETYSIKEGDIFLTRTSEVVDELAMSCVALKNYDGATYSGFLKRLRPIQQDIAYPKYMGFYLRSPMFRKVMTNNAVMTLRASLNEAIFSYLPIFLPDYNEQKKIGDFLYLLNEKIRLNNEINKELEEIIKVIFDYWFLQFNYPNSNGNPYNSSRGEMIYNEKLKFSLPFDWTVGTLNDIGEIVGGSTPSTNDPENFTSEGITWITPNDLSNNKGNKYIEHGTVDLTDKGFREASLKKYPKGTVLFSSRAPIGYLAIASKELTTNQGFKSFIPSKGFSPIFIFYTLKNYLKIIEKNATGSTFKEVSGSTLKSIQIALPPLNLVKKFDEIIEPFLYKQQIVETQNYDLSNLRDWLLPMLMNGQISIRDAEEHIARTFGQN